MSIRNIKTLGKFNLDNFPVILGNKTIFITDRKEKKYREYISKMGMFDNFYLFPQLLLLPSSSVFNFPTRSTNIQTQTQNIIPEPFRTFPTITYLIPFDSITNC